MKVESLTAWLGPALLQEWVARTPEKVGWSDRVKQWCMGGNDQPNTGDCALAAFANLEILVTTVGGRPPIVMPDVEVMSAYREMTGWLPNRSETDRGIALADVLDYLDREGWPGDPTLRPSVHCPLQASEIAVGISIFGAVYAWCELPVHPETADHDDGWDFTDASLDRGVPGTGPHAVLLTDSGPDTISLITWARRVVVSHHWWQAYGRGQFGVLLPEWKRPSAPLVS